MSNIPTKLQQNIDDLRRTISNHNITEEEFRRSLVLTKDNKVRLELMIEKEREFSPGFREAIEKEIVFMQDFIDAAREIISNNFFK